jgi:murein DD-endopeptidase MepM/ murein hydrolase activator NlpD
MPTVDQCLGAVTAILLAVTLACFAALPAAAEPDPIGVWPLDPQPAVLAGFDPPDAPWLAGHRGVDLLGHAGQEVLAALAGRVTFAGMLAGRGVVVVLHGDTRTTYEPVTATVPVGQLVGRGEVIGRLDAAGSHCPPQVCLHWGWLRGEVYLDPLDLVGSGSVRLLPLWRDEPVAALAPAVGPVLQVLPWLGPYAALVARDAQLTARSPPGYARGCACW